MKSDRHHVGPAGRTSGTSFTWLVTAPVLVSYVATQHATVAAEITAPACP